MRCRASRRDRRRRHRARARQRLAAAGQRSDGARGAATQFLPMADQTIAKEAPAAFQEAGSGHQARRQGDGRARGRAAAVDVVYADAQGEHTLQVDKLVVAVGRRPFTEGSAGRGHRRRSSTRAASSRSTSIAAPARRTSGRSAMWCAAPCWRTRARRRASWSPT